VVAQLFDHQRRRHLPGGFLGWTLGAGRELFAHARLHSEQLGVLRPLLVDDLIARNWELPRLCQFLQSALGVEFHVVLEFVAQACFEDQRFHKAAARLQSAVNVNGGNQGFERIGQDRLFRAPPALLLAMAELQVLAQRQFRGDFEKMTGTDTLGLEPRQFPLGTIRTTAQDELAGHKAQNRVAQKLQLFVVVYRYGLFYATPLVLNSIADIMQDGAIMLNQEGQIIYLNASAERLVHRERGFPLGRPLGAILPTLQAAIRPNEEGSAIIEMANPEGRILRLEVRYSPVMVDRKKVSQLLILRDITSQRRAEEALASSNSKLNVLYGVTRHDILNRITVIRGYGQLLSDKTEKNSQASEYLMKMMDSTVAIEHLITFTRDYEKVGIMSPEWQNVGRVYQKAKVLCAEQGVEYIVDTGTLEIYADPMLERLFYILLDNTNRHGSKVTTVELTASKSPEGYSIIYEDDRVGVRSEDKGRIFLKGFGKDSGLGLYLGMQILSITGIGIRENGEYLKGARFEISVPDGKWRRTGFERRQ